MNETPTEPKQPWHNMTPAVSYASCKSLPTPPPEAAGETANENTLEAVAQVLDKVESCAASENMPYRWEPSEIVRQASAALLALTSKLAELTKERDEQKAKLDYVQSMGLRFGMMKTSDKPEPYLAHTWSEDSDYERMFREWTDSIGWEDGAAKLKSALTEEKAIVSRIWAIYGNPCYESLAGKSIYDLIEKDRSALTTKTLELEESRLSPVAMKLAESQAEAHELSHKLAAKTLEAEGLRKDKERLDWLQGNTATFLSHYNRTGSVRLAIDAALSAAGEEARP